MNSIDAIKETDNYINLRHLFIEKTEQVVEEPKKPIEKTEQVVEKLIKKKGKTIKKTWKKDTKKKISDVKTRNLRAQVERKKMRSIDQLLREALRRNAAAKAEIAAMKV